MWKILRIPYLRKFTYLKFFRIVFLGSNNLCHLNIFSRDKIVNAKTTFISLSHLLQLDWNSKSLQVCNILLQYCCTSDLAVSIVKLQIEADEKP